MGCVNAERRQASPAALFSLFSLFALVHGLALASRFPELAQRLPPWAPRAVLLTQLPLLLIAVYFDAGIRGEKPRGLPNWMWLRSGPLKLGLALAFSYFAMVVLQTWDIQLGPVDPTPPPGWPLAVRARHFGLICLAGLLPGYIAMSSLVVPPLRRLARLLQRCPAALAAALLGAVGLLVGLVLLLALESARASEAIASVQDLLHGDGPLMIGVTVGVILIPTLLGLLTARRKD